MTTPNPQAETGDPREAIARRGGRIAIVAGSGLLPVELAQKLHDEGTDPFVVRIAGEAGDDGVFSECDGMTLEIEELGSLIRLLSAAGVSRLVLAGGISRRPKLRRMRWTWPLLRVAFRLAPAMARGDDNLLRTAISFVEEHGITVMGAHEVMPDLLCEEGLLTTAAPDGRDRGDIDAGMKAARALGALDIGQAAIAIGGRVVAVEDIEGTDALLARAAALRDHGRLAGAKRGVLAKSAKPGQELRADLPAIGPHTVAGATKAGLAGIVLEANRSLILAQNETLAAANEAGVFILGMRRETVDD